MLLLLHMRQPSVYGRVSQISAIYLFLCVFYAILRCISFKIRVNFLIELLRIYKTMVLTSFFDFIQAPSMRISLILHLNFAHIKPQQPNPVILVTILGKNLYEIFFSNLQHYQTFKIHSIEVLAQK